MALFLFAIYTKRLLKNTKYFEVAFLSFFLKERGYRRKSPPLVGADWEWYRHDALVLVGSFQRVHSHS